MRLPATMSARDAMAIGTAGYTAMLAVMALEELVVYETLGVAVLRRIWINLDLIWGGALIAAGIIMVGMA